MAVPLGNDDATGLGVDERWTVSRQTPLVEQDAVAASVWRAVWEERMISPVVRVAINGSFRGHLVDGGVIDQQTRVMVVTVDVGRVIVRLVHNYSCWKTWIFST